MQYLCLVHAEMADLMALSPEEGQRLNDDSINYDVELSERGHRLTSRALQSPESAVIVRVRDGRMSSTDGPFAETREQLAGFILIEARDLNEAIQIAAGIPMARVGAIEVRPVLGQLHSEGVQAP